MCRIAICTKSRMTKNVFMQSWESNPDGAGYAFYKGGKIQAIKGMMRKDVAHKIYRDIPLPHIAHFRIGTGGGTMPSLTHPFLCLEDSPSFKTYSGDIPLLFHNGIVSGWTDIAMSHWAHIGKMPAGPWNDSRLVATMIARIPQPQYVEYLKHVVGDNKFAIMFRDRICRVGNFYGEGGILYSDITPHELSEWQSRTEPETSTVITVNGNEKIARCIL